MEAIHIRDMFTQFLRPLVACLMAVIDGYVQTVSQATSGLFDGSY